MFAGVRTLRFRLVVLNLLVFGLLQVALVGLVFYVCDRFFRWDFDQRLIAGASGMIEALDVTTEELAVLPLQRRLQPILNPFRFLDYYFQVRSANGAIIERSANLREWTLPPPTDRQAAAHGAVLETLSGDMARTLAGPGHSLRLLSVYHRPPGGPVVLLQVAVSLAPIDDALLAVRRAILWLVPVGLFIAALASWGLVRRALAPIGRIAREAQTLTAEHLDRRLAMPPGRDEVVELVATLNDMLSRLQAAFAAQERFIANAAHELRTPVTHLLGQAQVHGMQARSIEEYDAFVTNVQSEMRHLGQVVESLLLLARADAGLPLMARELVSANDVATDAVQRCHAYAGQREVRVAVTLLPDDAPDEGLVLGDAELLVTMASNLVRNAIRFSPPGQEVVVEVHAQPGHVQIAVRDHGPGVAPELLPRLFERFSAAERGGVAKGTGLGLAIAQSVARLHGGTIAGRNEADGGSVFVITLPTQAAPAE